MQGVKFSLPKRHFHTYKFFPTIWDIQPESHHLLVLKKKSHPLSAEELLGISPKDIKFWRQQTRKWGVGEQILKLLNSVVEKLMFSVFSMRGMIASAPACHSAKASWVRYLGIMLNNVNIPLGSVTRECWRRHAIEISRHSAWMLVLQTSKLLAIINNQSWDSFLLRFLNFPKNDVAKSH